MGVKRIHTPDVATEWNYYRNEEITSQFILTSADKGVNIEGKYQTIVFDIGIKEGAGSYRPQVVYWNPLLRLWIAEKAYPALTVSARITILDTNREDVALQIPEMIQTEATFKLVAAWRGIY